MKRIGIVGAARFGMALAESLASQGADVLVLDRNEDVVQRLSGMVNKAVQGDATEIRVLAEAGFAECEMAVVTMGTQLEASILATMNLKDLKVPYVVARAGSDAHGRVLQRVGADLVVYPNRERAERLARSLLAGSALDYFEISEGMAVVEMDAPPIFVGKTLAESDVRRAFGVTILAIKRKEKDPSRMRSIVSPNGEEKVRRGDRLVMFGPDDKLSAVSWKNTGEKG